MVTLKKTLSLGEAMGLRIGTWQGLQCWAGDPPLFSVTKVPGFRGNINSELSE